MLAAIYFLAIYGGFHLFIFATAAVLDALDGRP